MASLEKVGFKKAGIKEEKIFYRVAYMWNGKRERVKIGVTSRRVALQRKAQIEALLAMGKNPQTEIAHEAASIVRLSELLQRDSAWCKDRMRPLTLRMNQWAMSQLIEWAGDKEVTGVTKEMIEGLLVHLRDELDRNETTANMILRQLKAIFQRAITEHGLLAEHPFRSVKPHVQRAAKIRANYLTVEQVELLIGSVPEEHFKRLLCFYLWTGCRRSEAVDLTWADVDWQNEVIYLGQAASKTKMRRTFPIGSKLEGLLKAMQKDENESGVVFWRFRNNVSHLSRKVQELKNKVEGLPKFLTLHTLRHTFASHLIMQGVDIMTVASLLGHTTSKTTELYAHLLPQHKKLSIERLPY